MILYSFVRCPFAIRARSTLLACKIEYEHREVNLKDKPQSLLEYSHKGTVPVLVLDDGTVIDESFDIMTWAIAQADPAKLYRAQGQDLIQDTMDNFLPGVYQCKYPERYQVDHAQVRQNNQKWLQRLEQLLTKTSFVIDNDLSYVDLAILPFIRQWRHIDIDYFTSLKQTNAWLNKITEQDFFQKAMLKHPVWQD